MPSTYPTENPAAKHDAKTLRLPPPGTPLADQSANDKTMGVFDTTPQLFRALQEPPLPDVAKTLCSFYSYSDAPTPPLSREVTLIGVARRSLPTIRKLIGVDDDADNDESSEDVADCLHTCTVAVRRADGAHLGQLDTKHQGNSKAFGKLMRRLREENLVAVVAQDKYQRFGLWRPASNNDNNNNQPYSKHDFYCTCYVGKVADVKDFLTGGRASSEGEAAPQNNGSSSPTYVPKSPPASELPDDANETGQFSVLWQPPEEEDNNNNSNGGGGFGGGNDNDDNSGDLWQPPGSSGGDSGGGGSGDLWQPPGADSGGGDSGGGGDFSWQPPESSTDFGDGGNAWEQQQDNGNGGDDDSNDKKRSFGDMEDDDDNNNGNNEEGGNGDDETFHANKGAAAADAFYSGLTRKLDTRADSRLYHMRAFNGWVKATQIQELDPRTSSSTPNGPMNILDLACGKGGDLGKWVLHNRGIKEYVGSDVARGSLRDAAIRARGMRHRLKCCTFTCADLGHDVPGRLRSPKQKLMQKLLTWSLQGEPERTTDEPDFKMVRGGGIRPDQMFDVVSIQFAIHYMMQTRQRARRFFHTVSQLLEVGGNLIATTIDARVVIDHLMNLGYNLHFDEKTDDAPKEPAEIRVGGGACRIRFEPEIVKKLMQGKSDGKDDCEDLFGLEYTFTLVEGSDHGAGVGDAVNLPEWLTPIPVLTTLANEVGMELEYALNFHEFYKQRKDPSLNAAAHGSLYSMKVVNRDGSISAEEWEISRLYCAVKFRKVREPTVVLEDENDEMEQEDDDDFEVDPVIKMKLMPMAMMKAKKAAGNDAWAAMSPEEKTQLTEVEVKKLAKAGAA